MLNKQLLDKNIDYLSLNVDIVTITQPTLPFVPNPHFGHDRVALLRE